MSEPSPIAASLAPPAPVLSVSMLNRMARERLESAFPLCWVGGEISNLSLASSGHAYFSLKDESSQVRCVMFRNRSQLLGWRLENGQHVEARVLVSLYEARGDFQLNVETVRKAGVGNLYERYLRLRDKLDREGLFAPELKRQRPAYPRRIGVVTSLQAAALRDVLTTLSRRAPHVGIVIYPTAVQGEAAAAQIVSAIDRASRRQECDLLILCRGGGSLEDLWSFNDEGVARAIRNCRLPVITGIGHETDFTIADLAADQRAPTPTAAAELAAPDRSLVQNRLGDLRKTLRRAFQQGLERHGQRLDGLAQRMLHPAQAISAQRQHLDHLRQRLESSLSLSTARGRLAVASLSRRLFQARPDTRRPRQRIESLRNALQGEAQRNLAARVSRIALLEAALSGLNPHAVLARGYSIASDAAGRILRDSRMLEPNDTITVCFHTGRAQATVDSLWHADSATEPEPPAAR